MKYQHKCFLEAHCITLLLDLPSESEEENLVNFIQCHCPLNIKAKLPAAGNCSETEGKNIDTSEFYPQSLREKTMFILFTIHALK